MKYKLIISFLTIISIPQVFFAQDKNSEKVVIIEEKIENENLVYKFENQRDFTAKTVTKFCQRLENTYSEKIESLVFLRPENSFELTFKGEQISKEIFEELKIHFDIDSYEFKK